MDHYHNLTVPVLQTAIDKAIRLLEDTERRIEQVGAELPELQLRLPGAMARERLGLDRSGEYARLKSTIQSREKELAEAEILVEGLQSELTALQAALDAKPEEERAQYDRRRERMERGRAQQRMFEERLAQLMPLAGNHVDVYISQDIMADVEHLLQLAEPLNRTNEVGDLCSRLGIETRRSPSGKVIQIGSPLSHRMPFAHGQA